MSTAVADAEHLLAAAHALRDALVPAGTRLADPHTHLGLDEDGRSLAVDDLLASMAQSRVERAYVFPLNEPDRRPRYEAPNDRVLEWAAGSDGRLVPLARLDLDDDPLVELRRCLAKGARGVKLHPRAQAFRVDDDRLDPVFALAEEERLPILIHAGRGMPPIGAHLARVAERHPGAILILAHAAIIDQEAIAGLMAGLPNVLFDTSTWSPLDIAGILELVPPEQVIWASDVPYGSHLSSILAAGVALEEHGASDELRRAVLGGTTLGLMESGRLPGTLSEPLRTRHGAIATQRLRVLMYLGSATPFLWLGRPDLIGYMGLAEGACAGDPALAPLGELIRVGHAVWDEGLRIGGVSGERLRMRLAFPLLHLALTLSVNPAAAERFRP